MSERPIKLGDEVEDVVTGFKGIVVAELRKLEGTVEMLVAPKGSKDELRTAEYFDVCRVKKISDGIRVKDQQRVLGFHLKVGDE